MTERYRFFDHTADVLFEAYGTSFEEALENAAQALLHTIADVEKAVPTESVPIHAKARNLDELVAYVLSDLVAERDARGLFFTSFKVESLTKNRGGFHLSGHAKGIAMTLDRGLMDVKAVTHHETRAFEKEGIWTVRVLLDI